jgi:hypothetical protein
MEDIQYQVLKPIIFISIHLFIHSFVRSLLFSYIKWGGGAQRLSHLENWAYAGPHDSYKTFQPCCTRTTMVKFILFIYRRFSNHLRSGTSNGRLLCNQCDQCTVEVKVLDGWVYSSLGTPSSLPLSTIHTQTHSIKHDKAIGLNGTCNFYKLATIQNVLKLYHTVQIFARLPSEGTIYISA